MFVSFLLASLAASAAGAMTPALSLPGTSQVLPGSFRVIETTYSYVRSVAPTIDGFMSHGEWDDACSTRTSSDSATVFLKQDEQYWYFAGQLRSVRTRRPGDQWGLCVDEDNDGELAPDSPEGNYWIWVNGVGSDEVLFRPVVPSGPGQAQVCPGAYSASSTAHGNLCFEARIPIGRLPYQVTLDDYTNDTVGLWLYGLAGERFIGWWPSSLSPDSWLRPSAWGKTIFCYQPVPGIEARDHEPAGMGLPRVARPGIFRIRGDRRLEVRVYDASGRCVRVVAGSDERGSEAVSLPLDLGQLASGIYYVQLKAGGAVRTAKLVLQQ